YAQELEDLTPSAAAEGRLLRNLTGSRLFIQRQPAITARPCAAPARRKSMRTPLALILAAGLTTAGLALAAPAPAEEAVFVMHKVDAQGVGDRIGEIR